jgi:hypothetical protein
MQNTQIHFKVYNVELFSVLILAVRRVTTKFYKVDLIDITPNIIYVVCLFGKHHQINHEAINCRASRMKIPFSASWLRNIV